MARKKVIVKNLATMQNFGSIDVLCSDKTGTLTSGCLVLDSHVDPFGNPSEQTFQFIYLNSVLQAGISNPVDESLRSVEMRNPLDIAILSHDHPDVRAYRKLAEVPFDFERRLVSVVVGNGDKRLLVIKGAPESVIARCTAYTINGELHSIDDAAHSRFESTYRDFCTNGRRVLAVAYRSIPAQTAYEASDERELVLVGFVTFVDPPLEESADALDSLHRDGIRVKIITGDNPLVAGYICERVGLQTGRIVEGDELDQTNDTALAHLVEQTTVFARVSPMQKNRIILALKARKTCCRIPRRRNQ
jgi:Mg2+-importing ATPase